MELLEEVNNIVSDLEDDDCRVQYEVVEGRLKVHIEKVTVLA